MRLESLLIKENKRTTGQDIQNNSSGYSMCCSSLIFFNFITQTFAEALIYDSFAFKFYHAES